MATSTNVDAVCTVNPHALDHYPFNIYTATSVGILQGYKLETHNSYDIVQGEPTRTKNGEITCLSWWNHDESSIIVGRRDGNIFNIALESGSVFQVPTEIPERSSSLKVIRSYENVVATAYSDGNLKCHKFETPQDKLVTNFSQDRSYPVVNISTGSNLYCMDHNAAFPNLYATGGKENSLKIWDVSLGSVAQPVFTAKNVKNDWLNLTVPIWETQAQFFSNSSKIVTGTGHGQIRVYDSSTPQRRPVIEIQTEFHKKKAPISAMTIRPNSDFQLVIGTTNGNLGLVDLRKNAIVKHFNGAAGGITCVMFHPKYPVFASSGLDGYVHCFDTDLHSRLKHSIYMRSPVNCLLFSSGWSLLDNGNAFISKYSEQCSLEKAKKINEVDKYSGNSSESEDDDVWKAMTVVKTKKHKRKTTVTDELLASKKKKDTVNSANKNRNS